MSQRHTSVKSFKYAWEGIRQALKDEPNLRVHFVSTILVFILAFLLGLSAKEWAILTLTIGLVICMELINTTLEDLVDIVSPEIKSKAKVTKDIAAATVLVSAITAVIVGTCLFLPKILGLLNY